MKYSVKNMKNKIIAGIDPGTTAAVVALDLDRNVVLRKSGREFSPDEIIEEIMGAGKPWIVATDKAKTPGTVQKIASSIGAEVYSPEKDLSQQEKINLGEGENEHERDAHASALKAHKKRSRQIRKMRGQEPEDSETDTLEDNEDIELEDREKHQLKSRIGELEKQVEKLSQKLEDTEKGRRDSDIEKKEILRLEKTVNKKNEEIDFYKKKIRELIDEVMTFEEGLENILDQHELVPIADKHNELKNDRVAVKDERLKKKLLKQGFNAETIENLEGLELERFIIVEYFPEKPDLEEILKNEDSPV